MVEHSIFQRMVEYGSLNRNDTVLDVGAGLGFLTRFMVDKCKRVIAVEADTELADILREQLVSVPNVEIVEGNVLEEEVPQFNKVVSIPPYRISSRLLLWLFNRGFDCAVLVFQKEFASRLVAHVESEDYGWLTVLAYYYAEAELLDEVPKCLFYPEPKIDSVITCLKSKNPRPFTIRDETTFKQMVQSLFTQRNKKLGNAVLHYLKGARGMPKENAVEIAKHLTAHGKRVRELAPEDFGALAHVLIE